MSARHIAVAVTAALSLVACGGGEPELTPTEAGELAAQMVWDEANGPERVELCNLAPGNRWSEHLPEGMGEAESRQFADALQQSIYRTCIEWEQ